MTFANTFLTFDPVWPWSLPAIGLPALIVCAVVLLVLTVATYLGNSASSLRRTLIVLALRLGALLVVALLVLRPALAWQDDAVVPTRLLILVDASQSMSVNDELNGQSRWDRARSLLRSPGVDRLLKKLQDSQRMEIVYNQGAEDVGRFDPQGKAEGKRTDMGRWLNTLLKTHGLEKNLRGLVLLSDGADNGTQFATLDEAGRWRNLGCPIQPFALGSPATTPRQRDVAFAPDKIVVTPMPVRVKNKMTVKALLNAPGFENARVTVRLFLDDKEIATGDMTLVKTMGNEVEMTANAPDQAGEVKVTLKVDPLDGEVSTLNNEISTYASVTKGGVSILWVEGKKRAFESVFVIRHVLGRDPRFRVTYAERLEDGRGPIDPDWFNFRTQHYDVIVIGDVSASRFCGGNRAIFREIKELVEQKKVGLMMLGGYETFANSDWQTVPEIRDLLPVEMNESGQVDGPVRMKPTPAGFQHYLLRLAGDRNDNQQVWDTVLAPLDGATVLGKLREGATLFATRDDTKPLLAGTQVGKGRVLAFGGDTTWKAWRRTPEAIKAYEQFWRHVMLWLAHQENAGGQVWIEPDTRRLAAGNNNRLGFTLKIQGKSGADDVKDAHFTAKVVGPGKDELEVPIVVERGEHRGYFWKTNVPGEYVIKATGQGKDPAGNDINGDAEARVLAYAEDLESLRSAADHDFLSRLARAGGGKMRLAGEGELEKYLQELLDQPAAQAKPRADLWPDWRRDPVSTGMADQLGALWESGLLSCFLVFCTLISVEWFLRRRWGMV